MRGRGKTNYLKSRLDTVHNLFIVDIRNEYQHISAFTKFSDFMLYVLNTYHNENLSNGNNHLPRYRFTFQSQQEYIKLFQVFSSFQNCTIVIDEADSIFSVRHFCNPLINVFLGSRNNNINMIFVAKRPFLIPILVRSQADEYVIFGTRESRDIDYLESRIQKQFPKNPFHLNLGEAILIQYDNVPELIQTEKWENKQDG